MSLACLTRASGAAPSPCAVAPRRRDVVAGATSTTARARRFANRGDASSSVSAPALSPSPASRDARRGAAPSTAARASSSSSASPASPFQQLESLLAAASAAANTGSRDLGWRELEGAWVLAPPAGAKPRALVHFIGGAFVGASPQLTYRLFLEALAEEGDVLVVATPYAIGFEHLRIADENQFLFDRALRALGDEAAGLPIFGVGHSMGALMHMIIGSRYALPDRAANVLISFNNKPATDAVPLFTPVVAPGLQNLSPLIASVADSPFRAPLRGAEAQLRAQAPAAVRELLPVLDQIEPVFREVADGAAEFVPKPEDTKSLIRRYYGVRRNLLLRFTDDTIDETSGLAATLTDSSAIKESIDLSVRSLAGDHVRPLRQETPALDVPPELAEPLRQTGDAISGFADALGIAPDENNPLNPLGALRFGFEQVKSETLKQARDAEGEQETRARGDAGEEMRALAGEIVAWMGLPPAAAPAAAPARDEGGREEVTPTVVSE
jgi:hypothetical protein